MKSLLAACFSAAPGGRVPQGQVEANLGQPESGARGAVQVGPGAALGFAEAGTVAPPPLHAHTTLALYPSAQGGASCLSWQQQRDRGTTGVQRALLGPPVLLLAQGPAAHAHLRGVLQQAGAISWPGDLHTKITINCARLFSLRTGI